MANQVLTAKLVRVEGIDELVRNVAKILDRTKAEKLKDTFMVAAKIVRDEVKDLAPVRKVPAGLIGGRKPGFLREQIFAAPGDPRQPNVLVGVSKAFYGALLERGTSKMSARPFFRPAIVASRATAARVIGDGLRKVIDEAAR